MRLFMKRLLMLAFVVLCASVLKYLEDDDLEFFSLDELAYIGLIVLAITRLYDWYTRHKRDTVLLLGLNDAGKTLIFTRMANKTTEPITYSSFEENEVELDVKGETLKVIDFPGAERLRPQLEKKWLKGNLTSTIRRIVFVVDSATFSKNARDVAEFLYDVLLETSKNVSVVIACNKQDLTLAKTDKVICSTLEKEIGLINVSRAASLVSTDGSSTRPTLTSTGNEFKWSDLNIPVEFLLCSAVDNGGLDDLRAKIKEPQL